MSVFLITTTTLPSATQGTAYSATLAATGGTTPYTWSIYSGALPTGLTLSTGGAISGTPSVSGVFQATFEVADAASQSSTARLTLNVSSSYAGSKASVPMETVLSVGPLVGTSNPTYVPVAELTAAQFSGAKVAVLNPTNFQSSMVEKLNTLADAGQVKITMNRITNDAGQLALTAAWVAGGRYLFQVQEAPDASIGQTTTGNLTQFAAIISDGPSYDLEPMKLPVLSFTLDISNAIAFTAGS
jgi:hypothetical protein